MENRKKAPHGFYTAKEAMDVLGVPNTSFYNLVNDEQIHKVLFPGRREAVYSMVEVDNYARNVKAFSAPYLSERMDFGLALNEDLPRIRELVASVSGGLAHAVPEDILKAWIRRNPQSVHILRKRDEIIGYVSAFPLDEDVLEQRLDGRLLNREIPIDAIQRFKPSSSIDLYVAEMAAKDADDHLGAILIRHTARFLKDLAKQGTAINNLHAVGTSEFGIHMCQKLGMQPLDLKTGVRVDRVPFGLNIRAGAGSRFVRKLVAA